MKNPKAYLVPLSCAALIAASGAVIEAQDTNSQQLDNGAKMMMKSPDVTFAIKAAQGGLAEVQLGQLASTKANSPDVKTFGQKMVDDHTKANNDLTAVAQKEGITLPTTLNGKDQAEYTKLQGLSGVAFDKEYVKDMVKDHEEDVKEFQKEASNGKDPQIKSFAAQTLPVLQSHLEMIKSIQSKTSGSSSTQ